MFGFAWPWLALLLPLPLLVRHLVPAAADNESPLRVPQLPPGLISSSGQQRPWRRLRLLVSYLCWLCLVLAVMRPQWTGAPVSLPESGRDLLLALDLSGSMGTEDFVINNKAVTRLQAARSIAADFISRRQGDRIGLILFGTNAYIQAPLTFDLSTVSRFLDESFLKMAGDRTAIGDAIGLAVKRLRQQPQAQKRLILMTDGANTAGVVDPRKAAELAAGEGVRIYTIGIGADEMMVRTFFFNQRVNPSADLDEGMLRTLAESTGGQYFRARDSEELARIYAEIDRLEPTQSDSRMFRPVRELFHYPLVALLLLALPLFTLVSWRFSRVRR